MANLTSKIQEMLEQIKRIPEESFEGTKQAVEKEENWRKELQKAVTWSHLIRRKQGKKSFAVKKCDELERKIKRRIRAASEVVLDSVNQKYMSSFELDEAVRGSEHFYYQNGILETLKHKGLIDGIFQSILGEIIPSHPKDEFPETRKIKRMFYIHTGPTNSGKTHSSIESLKSAENGAYLAPLRLLALEIYEKMNEEGVWCDLLTGEEEIQVPGARHVSSTAEKADYKREKALVVVDETQMIGDSQRGSAWTRAILGVKTKEAHVICSLNAVGLIQKIIEDCGDSFQVVQHERQTPLIVEKKDFSFPKSVEKGDALVVFSRRAALQVASDLSKEGISASVIYGNLPPETRRKQVEQFWRGETEVVVSTDAIGMGLNLPIRRIVFLESEKFDGVQRRPLTTQEVKQIAGRAGRKGLYEQGFVNALSGKNDIAEKLFAEDEPVETAYIAPLPETILELPFGTLKERLVAWSNHKTKTEYIKKVDISAQLELLEAASAFEEMLSIEQLHKAVMIPFSLKDESLLEQWLSYLKAVERGLETIPKPKKAGAELSDLESYYQALDLHYSFGKSFSFPIETEWVRSERTRTSEEIHRLLKSGLEAFQHKCKQCKNPMPWNFAFGVCDRCFSKAKRRWIDA